MPREPRGACLDQSGEGGDAAAPGVGATFQDTVVPRVACFYAARVANILQLLQNAEVTLTSLNQTR